MSAVSSFLVAAARRIERRRAVIWTLRGAAVAAVGVLLAQLVSRRWPIEPGWLPLAAAIGMGIAVATCGWFRARPSLAEVARVADVSLGGYERLSTALELVDHPTSVALVAHQRADAEAWASRADPHQVARTRLPRSALVVAMVAITLTGLLAAEPNPMLARMRAEQRAEATREEAADEVGDLADDAAAGAGGGDPAQREALVRELSQAQEALRKAESNRTGVAAISRAQEVLRRLTDPSGGARRRNAAIGAGAALGTAGAAGSAGAALAAVGDPAADNLEQMAQDLPGLEPEDRAALSSRLSEAAGVASLAGQLSQASASLAGGDIGAASSALAAAASNLQQQNAANAAAELAALAQSIPELTPEELAELAQAMERAASAAADDPGLSEALREAAAAAREDRAADIASALEDVGRRAQTLGADAGLDSDVAESLNGLQSVKDSLLSDVESSGSSSGSPQPGSCPTESERENEGEEKAAGATQPLQSSTSTLSTTQQCSGQGSGGGEQGSQAGGAGGDDGGGKTAPQQGGGSSAGGAEGALGNGQSPGRAGEQVYVPSVSGPGRASALPGAAGGGEPIPYEAIPYERVYAEYREQAFDQTDRQVIPERFRGLVRQYFQESPP